MINALSRISLSKRIFLLIALVAISAGGLLSLSYYYLREALYTQHINATQNLVQCAQTALYHLDRRAQLGEISVDYAKEMALEHVSHLRYGKEGYYWINNTEGIMLSHPNKDLVNTDMLHDKDAHGKEFIKEIITTATSNGEGLVSYYWPPNNSKKKLSYVVSIPQWNWVLGSGIHTDDIEKDLQDIFTKLVLTASFALIILLLIAIAIGRTIQKPISRINTALQQIAEGNLDADLPSIPNTGDEIGAMAKTVRVFIYHARLVSKMEAEKKALEKTKSEFVSVVSHELRTPLTSIKGSLGLVLGTMKETLPEKTFHLINMAHENCDRLIFLVNDLLDIDKAASGEMAVDIKCVALHPTLQIATENNESYAKKYHVRIVYEPIDENIMIDVDRARLLQVLANLLSNAAKFSPAGGNIMLGAEKKGGKICIYVTDHGLGIPEKARETIFAKFTQADSSATRKQSGTGLGLSITKTLVELMNGEISFDSKDGFGTTFWVTFPLPEEKMMEE